MGKGFVRRMLKELTFQIMEYEKLMKIKNEF